MIQEARQIGHAHIPRVRTAHIRKAIFDGFIGGMLLGVWFILAGIDGFIFGSSTSIFAQLNIPIANMGTFIFGFLTLLYTMGTIGSVSRGSV